MTKKIWSGSLILLYTLLLLGFTSSTVLAEGGYQLVKTQENSPSECPYQNPPKEKLQIEQQSSFTRPKTVDKGDYFYRGKEKVSLLRLKDQVIVKGEGEKIDSLIKGWGVLKVKNIQPKKKTLEDSFLYQFEIDTEEDLEVELFEELKADPGVQSVSPVFFNEESGLRSALTDEIAVKLKAGYQEIDLLAITTSDIVIRRSSPFTPDVFLLTLTRPKEQDALAISRWYAESEITEWAEPNFMSEIKFHWDPQDPYYDLQWHLKNTGQGGGLVDADIDANQAWDLTTGSSNIVVAVINSGVQTDHPDLEANIWTNPGEVANGLDDDGNGYVDDLHGWNFYNDNYVVDPTDPADNHGTCCAGVIAACNNTAGGIGIAPQITILPIKIATGPSWVTDAGIAEAINYAAQYADILSCSWGYPQVSSWINDAIDNATNPNWGKRSSPVFFSAGNGADAFKYVSYRDDISPGNFLIPPGTHTYAWLYRKDMSLSDGYDSVWVDKVVFPNGEAENFSGGIPSGWVTATGWNGYAPFTWTGWYSINDNLHYWFGPDIKSLKSGNIGDNQYTFLKVTKTNYDWGDLIFGLWTSTEEAWDNFEFYLDDVLVFSWTGESVSDYNHDPSIVNQIGYPASYSGTIAVGSCTNYNLRSFYSQFSTELDFVAPSDGGTLGIYTTDRTGAVGYTTTSYHLSFGGTSSACPLAAGIAALLLSREPDLTAEQIRQRLRNTADKIGPVSYVNGRNNYYGYGKVNAYNALTPALTPPANLQASDGTYQDKVHLTWTGVLGAMGYDIYRTPSGGGAKTLIKSWHNAPEFDDTTASPDEHYYYWVKAVNERRESDFSAYDIGWRPAIHVYPGGSIQTVVANSQNGAIILIHPGTYTERIDFSGKAITIRSTNPDDPDVVNATIIDGNRAGSVIVFDQGEGPDSILEGLTIRNGYSEVGGGIYFFQSSPTISQCNIIDNETIYYGGGMEINYYSSPIITKCTIKHNFARYYGGGIECWDNSSPVISNCLISANSTLLFGGAIDCDDYCTPTITNCTMVGNSAAYGGGLWCSYSSPTITNCILWGNSPQQIYLASSSYPIVTYSDIQGGYTGTGNINADPLFVDLSGGNYHLQANSPCKNSGTGNSAPDTDKDGLPRPIGAGYDLGAYEYREEMHVYPGGSIQSAINTAGNWYVIIVHPGIYYENIDFNGKPITLRSTNPTDPAVVNTTIIDGRDLGSVVKIHNGEGNDSILSGLTIRNGYGHEYGGAGIFIVGTSPTITYCTITGNYIPNDDWDREGAGIYLWNSSATIAHCTITGNTGDKTGGIHSGSSSPVIDSCLITQNSAAEDVGGINIECGSAVVKNCTISGNTAGDDIGGISLSSENGDLPMIINCTITGNSADDDGGGIKLTSNDGNRQTIINCIIAGNSADDDAGGIYDTNGAANIINCTITGNSAVDKGDGIYCSNSTSTITNSIIWNNSTQQIYISSGSYPAVTYTDFQGGYTGTGNINLNPLFVNSTGGNYHLLSGSPCIDTATNNGAPSEDKDGVLRPRDGDGNGSAITDMGAYEFLN